METFRIKAVPAPGCCTLALCGEADVAVAPDIVALGTVSLCEDSTSKLIIDFADLTFMDSSAIGALIHLRERRDGVEQGARAQPRPISRVSGTRLGGTQRALHH